jgi:hypothetical protein
VGLAGNVSGTCWNSGVGEELLESLAAFEAAFADLSKRVSESAWQLSDADTLDVLRRLSGVSSKAAGTQAQIVRQVETRAIPDTMGATSLRTFLMGTLRLSPAEAGRLARLSSALHATCTDTAAALAAGAINSEQAHAITSMIRRLPSKAPAEQKAWGENFLLEHAAVLNAAELSLLSKRLDSAIDPDGKLPREDAAFERRAANVRDNHDGTQTLTWRDTDETIAGLKAVLFPLAAPVPAADGAKDERSGEQRRADAMSQILQLANASPDVPTSRGERPRLVITATPTTLRTGDGFGHTSTGEDLPGAALRRIACDADVFALLMTELGAPLKLGRRRRTVSPSQWIALVARDHGCQMPGCTRPAEFADAHHLKHWIDGGPTDLDNLGLFCGYDHHQIHAKGWEAFLGDDRRIWLRPPDWSDPERTPVRNTYWDTQQASRDGLNDPPL